MTKVTQRAFIPQCTTLFISFGCSLDINPLIVIYNSLQSTLSIKEEPGWRGVVYPPMLQKGDAISRETQVSNFLVDDRCTGWMASQSGMSSSCSVIGSADCTSPHQKRTLKVIGNDSGQDFSKGWPCSTSIVPTMVWLLLLHGELVTNYTVLKLYTVLHIRTAVRPRA